MNNEIFNKHIRIKSLNSLKPRDVKSFEVRVKLLGIYLKNFLINRMKMKMKSGIILQVCYFILI